MSTFENTPFLPAVQRVLKSAGYLAPTSIQAQSWPILLEKRDVISVARTGSGKTCGFLLPAFHKLQTEREAVAKADVYKAQRGGGRSGGGRRKIPQVLVLAPTRELAVQIESEAQKFSYASGVSTMCMFGGAPKGEQLQRLRMGVDVVVATPGRCNDLSEMGALDLSNIQYLVLDEADRMLDMGFEPQIRTIINQIPPERQSVFFTATWPKEVQSLASEFLTDPVHISVGDQGGLLNANKAITQIITVLQSDRDKGRELQRVMTDTNPR